MSDLRLVRMKTGKKMHLSPAGSVMTICGRRYAMVLKRVPANGEGCEACGIAPEMGALTIAEWIGLPVG